MPDYQALRSDIAAAEAVVHGPECAACTTIKDAPKDDADVLRHALSSKIGAEKLAAVFSHHGIPIGRRGIVRHRKEGHKA